MSIVLSGEHAGNQVPPEYRTVFTSDAARVALDSHRGWDPGSAELGTELAAELDTPFIRNDVTRLLVECNRSEGHPSLWSEFSRNLPEAGKRDVLERYWRRHRDSVRRAVRAAAEPGPAIHVGIHTFSPTWKGRRRETMIGVLYDPRRAREREFARRWCSRLRRLDGMQGLSIHLNRPYRGWTDGLTTTLRSELGEEQYLGLELEVSQALVPISGALVRAIGEALVSTLPA